MVVITRQKYPRKVYAIIITMVYGTRVLIVKAYIARNYHVTLARDYDVTLEVQPHINILVAQFSVIS